MIWTFEEASKEEVRGHWEVNRVRGRLRRSICAPHIKSSLKKRNIKIIF